VISGSGSTNTRAEPLPVPLQCASFTEEIVSSANCSGDTVREAVFVVMPLWMTPSLQVIENGGVPISSTGMVALCPGQMVVFVSTNARGPLPPGTTTVSVASQPSVRFTVTDNVTSSVPHGT
jgi:hypothetical protein